MQGSQYQNKRHFQEVFEDSEMQVGSNHNYVDFTGPGQAIQLIKVRPYGKIEIDQSALDLIGNCDMPVGFACLCGKYRTGKSFLINKLLRLEGKGFRVDPSTNACTEGIWMWSKPLINQREGNYIFFLDTEGMASLNRDSTNDAKVFTLANLISSYLMFNSVGSIDEKAISELNLITQLSKNIILEEYSDLHNNEQNLFRYMPKFLWVLRDFTLQIVNQQGKSLTPPEYLEDVLFQQNSEVKMNQGSKKIRRALTKYYKERDCITLVRPAFEESDLQNLNQLPDHRLRRDFIEGVNALRNKILMNCGPKTFQGTPLYGGSIASMIESYVQMMNDGAIPSIRTAWDQINEDQGVYAYTKALEVFNELYEQNFQEDQPKGQQIHNLLRVISQASLDEFNKNISQPNDIYENKLRQYLNEKETAILKVNRELIQFKNIDILKQCMGPVLQKVQANSYDNNPDQINEDIKKASQQFNRRAKGQNKGQILAEFLTTMNPIILQLQKQKDSNNDNQMKSYEKEEYERKIRTMQQKIAILERQATKGDQTGSLPGRGSRNSLAAGGKTGSGGKTGKGEKSGKSGKDPNKAGCCGKSSCSMM